MSSAQQVGSSEAVEFRLSRSQESRLRAFSKIHRSFEQLRRECGSRAPTERRRQTRYAVQTPVYCRTALRRGLTVTVNPGEVLLAVTLNISRNGLGLVHDTPWRGRRLLVEFDVHEEQPLRLLLDLCWSSRVSQFEYRSGGAIAGILRPAPLPLLPDTLRD